MTGNSKKHMRTSKKFGWLEVSQLFAFAIGAFAFTYWAPWTTSITTSEAMRRFPGQADPSWKAAVVNHASVEEWRWGTARENPARFTACTAVVFGGIGYAFAVALIKQARAN